MKSILFFALLFCGLNSTAQTYEDSIIEIRVMHMGDLIDTASGILNQEEINQFQGLSYFEVDTTFRLTATFTISKGKKFKMPTSTERLPVYRRFGYVDFEIDDKSHRLTVYQNMELKKNKEFKDYLFVPFRDSTSNYETYGGGRYLDLRIPKGNTIILDFNRVYNPYCVYSHRYSCPIPPTENTLKVPIRAGEKVPVGYSKEH